MRPRRAILAKWWGQKLRHVEWVQDWVRCGELGDSFKENKTVSVAHCQEGRVSGGGEQEELGSCWEVFCGEREQSVEDKSGFSRRAVSVTLGGGGWPGRSTPAVGYCTFASRCPQDRTGTEQAWRGSWGATAGGLPTSGLRWQPPLPGVLE